MSKKIVKAIDVTLEASLCSLFANREQYNSYIHLVDIKRVCPPTAIVLKDYKKYYELTNKDNVDFGEFYTYFSQDWHSKDLEQSDIEYYRDYVFPAIQNVSPSDIDHTIETLLKKQYGEDIEKLVNSGMDVSKIKESIVNLERKLTSVSTSVDKDVHTIANLDFSVLDKSNGIPWFLPSLQQNLMSITEGQFIIVSADYGTGKTAFVISQAVHTLKYLQKKKDNRCILYINSEGMAADVIGRALSNLYKDKVYGGFEEIVDRIDEIKEKYLKVFSADALRCIQMSDVSNFEMLKSKVEKYKPSLIIIDICDKLAPEEDVQNLKKLYDNLRVLASSGYAIIGTSQSGDTSYFDAEEKKVKNKKWLSDHDLYGSKTGKGGSADCIITIGKEENSNLRYVSVVKKKRGQPVRITCQLDDQYSNYRELQY